MSIIIKMGIVIALCIVMCLAVLYFFTIPYGENIIRSTIEKKIGESLGLQVRIGSFETNLLSRVQIGDVSLREVSGTEKLPFASVEYACAEYRLWRVLSLKPYIDQFTIDSLSVNVIRDSSGYRLPVSRKKKRQDKPQKPLDFGFQFAHLDLGNSSVTYDDYSVPLYVSASDINVNIREKNDSEYMLRLLAGGWEIVYRDHPVSLDSLTISSTISPDEIFIESLELSLPGLQGYLQTTVDMADSPWRINGAARIQGNITPIAELFGDTIPERVYPRKGKTETTFGFSGTIDDPEITLSMGVHDVEFKDTFLENLTLEGNYRNRLLNLQRISLELLDGTVFGKGTVATDSLFNHNFSLEISKINFERIWELVYHDVSPYKGRFNGSLETSGPLKTPQKVHAKTHLSFDEVTYQSQQLEDFNTDISFKDGVFDLEFKQSTTELRAGITLDKDEILGNFQFHTTKPGDLTGFAKIFDLYGSLDAKGVLSGNLKNPSIITDLSGHNIRIYGFPLDSLKGKVIYENKKVSFEECAFSGNVASVDSLTNHFHVPDLYGGLFYSGILNGPLSDPDGQIELRFTRPAYKNFQFDRIEAKLSITDRKVVCKYSRIEKDSLAVELHGNYTIPSSSGDAELVFSRLTEDSSQSEIKQRNDSMKEGLSVSEELILGKMNLEFAFADLENILLNANGVDLNIGQIIHMYSDSLQVTGLLDFNLEFKGSPRNPTGNLQFVLNDPGVKGVAIDSVSSTLRIDHDKLTISMVEMYLNSQRTWATAEIGLKRSSSGYPTITGQSNIRCNAEGKNITAQLLKLVMPPEMGFTGSSTYNLECQGTLRKPGISGVFHIIDAELQVKPDTPPIQNLNIRAVLQDSVLIIDPAEGTINGEHVIVNGIAATNDWEQFRTEVSVRVADNTVIESAGIVSADTLDYRVTISDMDIAVMQTMISNSKNLSGGVTAMLKISGTLRDPVIEGDLTVTDVSFIFPLLELPVTQGYTALRFDRNTVHMDSLSADVNKGKLFAYGTVVHDKGALSEIDIKAGILNTTIYRPKEYTLTIDSAFLTCKKQDNYYNLEGEIVLGESRLVKDFPPRSFITFLQKVERPSKTPSPLLQQIRTNVLIKGSQKLWIDNNLARMRIRSEIGLIGTIAHPNVTGRLSVEEGYVVYLNKKFKINRGIIDSFDQNRFSPEFDFQAESNLKSYQTVSRVPYHITMNVNGTMDKIIFELTSDPPEDKSDIIALLTVGATRDQLTGRSLDGTDVSLTELLKERAAELSSQKISSYVSQKAGNFLGLEEISIEGNLFQVGKSSGPQLIASEKISNRMDINYTTAVGHLNEQRIRLDYLLNKYFSLVGETDQKGRSGIDLKYRLRFK